MFSKILSILSKLGCDSFSLLIKKISIWKNIFSKIFKKKLTKESVGFIIEKIKEVEDFEIKSEEKSEEINTIIKTESEEIEESKDETNISVINTNIKDSLKNI